ncbi:MAG: hypothetical protein LBQ69_03630 [Treponema sp.]|jgi:hypothetical protein|nr:hypothetical protein [Treponema sp.]
MNEFIILWVIAFVIYFVGIICIINFIPLFFIYGIKIIDMDMGKMGILDFSDRIGSVYIKNNVRIKIISENEFLFVQKPDFEWRLNLLLPYFINNCIIENGEYKIISRIPLTNLIFPIVIIVNFILEQGITENIKIQIGLCVLFLIFHLFMHNWKLKYMLFDINKFVNGIEL